jgi:hypothetical protein
MRSHQDLEPGKGARGLLCDSVLGPLCVCVRVCVMCLVYYKIQVGLFVAVPAQSSSVPFEPL